MITEKDLQEAIAECEGQRNPTANTCIKLAAFYTIKQHMFPESKATSLGDYPFEAPTIHSANTIQYDSGTEFSGIVNGRNSEDVLSIIDDLMNTLSVINPKLYNSVLRELSY